MSTTGNPCVEDLRSDNTGSARLTLCRPGRVTDIYPATRRPPRRPARRRPSTNRCVDGHRVSAWSPRSVSFPIGVVDVTRLNPVGDERPATAWCFDADDLWLSRC